MTYQSLLIFPPLWHSPKMGRRVILRKRFIRFADFFCASQTFDWHVYTCLIISLRGVERLRGHKQQGRGNLGWRTVALIELVGSSPVSPAWHSKFSHPACKLLWPFITMSLDLPFFKMYSQKMKTLFFFLLCLCVIAVNARLKMSLAPLNYLNCQELDWMKSARIRSSIHGPGSASCWFVLVCDILKLVLRLIWLPGTVALPNHGLATSFSTHFARRSPFAARLLCWVEVRGSQCHVSENISLRHSLSLLV